MAGHPEYERLAARPPNCSAAAATHLPIVEEHEAAGEVAELYERFRAEFGRPQVPPILKCFATHPPLLRSMVELAQGLLFTEGHLTRRHKEMIATFVSARNACPYCADSHGYFLRVHGGSKDVLRALERNNLQSPALSSSEQALLRFVDQVNRDAPSVTSADAELLAREGWNSLQIAEAVHLAALFAMFNRVANAFGLPSQGLLEQFDDLSPQTATA
jgi:uncharacterized peroxidase-related enzyme